MSVPIPEGSVVITPTEVYREMLATHQAVQGVAAKLDTFQATQSERMEAIDGPDGKLKDLETRMRAVERFRWRGAGAAAAVATAASSGAAAAILAAFKR